MRAGLNYLLPVDRQSAILNLLSGAEFYFRIKPLNPDCYSFGHLRARSVWIRLSFGGQSETFRRETGARKIKWTWPESPKGTEVDGVRRGTDQWGPGVVAGELFVGE